MKALLEAPWYVSFILAIVIFTLLRLLTIKIITP